MCVWIHLPWPSVEVGSQTVWGRGQLHCIPAPTCLVSKDNHICSLISCVSNAEMICKIQQLCIYLHAEMTCPLPSETVIPRRGLSWLHSHCVLILCSWSSALEPTRCFCENRFHWLWARWFPAVESLLVDDVDWIQDPNQLRGANRPPVHTSHLDLYLISCLLYLVVEPSFPQSTILTLSSE